MSLKDRAIEMVSIIIIVLIPVAIVLVAKELL
jgi:hypothetical protein